MTESDGAHHLMLLTRELRRQLADLFAEESWMAEKGFRPPCAGVLRTVAALGPMSQREISEQVGLDPSDLVGAIDILEAAGFVERRRDPDDRRRHAVMITKAGAKAADRLRVLMIEAEVRTLANLDDDERAQFGVLLQKALGAPVLS